MSFGNKTVTVAGASWPGGTVHGGFGNLKVDLSRSLLTKDETLQVVSVAGDTTIDLPQTLTQQTLTQQTSPNRP